MNRYEYDEEASAAWRMDVVHEVDDSPTPVSRWVDAMRRLNTINDPLARKLLALHRDCGAGTGVCDSLDDDPDPMDRRSSWAVRRPLSSRTTSASSTREARRAIARELADEGARGRSRRRLSPLQLRLGRPGPPGSSSSRGRWAEPRGLGGGRTGCTWLRCASSPRVRGSPGGSRQPCRAGRVDDPGARPPG